VNREDFVYNVYHTGHGDRATEIIEMIGKADYLTAQHIDDLRDAAYQYLCISMDYQKLLGFLLKCNALNRDYCLSWDQAVEVVIRIIAWWEK
jgi:hypothetical protein